MNPALIRLIGLQTRGLVRRMVHGATSPRRAVFLVVGILVIVLWFGPSLVTRLVVRHVHPERLASSSERFRSMTPLMLLGICFLTIVSSAGDKAIAFTAGEVDFLFPGPFSRRQLLLYKLLKSALAAMLSGLLLSLALLIYAQMWVACFIGVFLTLLFIQLFSTAGVLLGQTVSQRAYTLARRGVLIVGLVLLLMFARQWLVGRNRQNTLRELLSSGVVRAALAPLEPFGRAITAGDFRELGAAGGQAALLDAGLLVLVVLLDENYLEAATAASQRRYAQIQRIRGGSVLASGVKGIVKWKLPQLPWAGGAGPVAWRQATSAARSAKALLLLLLILAVAIGPLFSTALDSARVSQGLLGALAWLTVLLSGLLKFDFRGDLDHMEELKTLPIRPSALAAGQIAVPTLILTGAHVLMLLGVAAAVPAQRDVLFVAACLALPFNALLMATENLIFLLFPTRPAAASPGDFQVLGRQAVQLVMKAIAMLIGCLVAFGIAVPLFIFTGGSQPVLTLVAGTILATEVVALIPAIAWAYNRFDPSVDTPA